MNLPNRYQNKLTNFRRQGEVSGDEVGEWQNKVTGFGRQGEDSGDEGQNKLPSFMRQGEDRGKEGQNKVEGEEEKAGSTESSEVNDVQSEFEIFKVRK